MVRRLTIKDEQNALKELGITPTKGSGNTWKDWEDGRNATCLVQRKATGNARSVSIKYQDLIDLIAHAEVAHKVPLFIFQVAELQFLCLPDFHIDNGVRVFAELQRFQEEKCLQ